MPRIANLVSWIVGATASGVAYWYVVDPDSGPSALARLRAGVSSCNFCFWRWPYDSMAATLFGYVPGNDMVEAITGDWI